MDRKPEDRAHNLAVRIYVELVARHTELTQESVKFSASASNMATLSLRLADAFLKSEEAANVAKAPAAKPTLEGGDFAAWLK